MKNPALSPTDAPPRDVRCTRCAHYFITHDPSFPYGCHALNFKSWRQPMLDVLESSGQQCLYFQPRESGRAGAT